MISGTLFKVLFAIFSLIITAADKKTGEVPRVAFVIAFPFFFVFKALLHESFPPLESIIGMLIGLVVFLIAFFISGRKLGLADVWYSALTGLTLGPWWWYAATGSACIAGIIYILVSKQRRIPFIPLMALGNIVMSIIQA